MRVVLSVAVGLMGCSTFLSEGEDEPGGDAGEAGSVTLDPEVVDVVDNWLYEARPDDAHGDAVRLFWDGDREEGSLRGRAVSLLRFELSDGVIPAGAVVESATLRLFVADHGNPGELVEVLVSWDGSTTWNTFGPTAGLVSMVDYIPSPVAAVETDGLEAQFVSIDVTSSVVAWLEGARENRGWLILGDDSDGSAVYASRAPRTRQPNLVVELQR